MKVKICGLKTPVEIDICVKANADFIGFVFFKNSLRHLTFAKASELSGHYDDYYSNSNLKKVALCLSLIHISEPTRLLSISYAVFCLKKNK